MSILDGMARTADGRLQEKAAERELVLRLLLTGMTARQAAATAGVSESAVSKWKADPAFQKKLAAQEHKLRKDGARRLQLVVKDAWDSLAAGVREDPRLAMELLRRCGAITSAGQDSGLDAETGGGGNGNGGGGGNASGLTVVINTHGADEPAARVIDAVAEHARRLE